MTNSDFLWCELYRPKTIEDCILPAELKKTFQQFVDQRNIPNLMLAGKPGVGKTTVARAMLEQLGCDYIIINGSLSGNIDTLRNDILQFASTVSFSGGRKYVILDEADYLNCLDGDELIKLSDGQVIQLNSMEFGVQYDVVSFNTTTKVFETNKAEVVHKTSKMVYEIELECGRTIKCTSDHPIICEDAEGNIVTRTIEEGLDGYTVVTDDALEIYGTSKIKSVTPCGVKQVVDLTVENNHTFVTHQGVVVHNCNSTQPALRNFMEEFSKNCGFILTCNFKNRIIEPLHSRCGVIEFNIPKAEKSKLAMQFFKRACSILEEQNVEYDQKAVAAVVEQHFPDWRRVLNELQRYSATGKIDSGILASIGDDSMKSLVAAMKNRKYSDVRAWVAEHVDVDPNQLFRKFYDHASDLFTPASIPQVVLTIADYSYKTAFVADSEVNTVACLTEIMVEAEFL